MPKLYRPSIPVETKCRVVLRQLGEMWPDKVIELRRSHPRDSYVKGLGVWTANAGGLGALLAEKLELLAELLNCDVNRLHLDHDPALGARARTGEGKLTVYDPPANDPDHLIYREKHAHHIKTNIRGEHGQHSDRVLIKKERRRREGKTKPVVVAGQPKPARCRSWPLCSCGYSQGRKRQPDCTKKQKRSFSAKSQHRPLKSANNWPPKGSRKIQNRKMRS